MEFIGKHFLLGVTGGVAAYKSAELVRLLIKQGATVQVVMTESATHFIAPLTFQALSGRPVFVSAWDDRQPNGMSHIDLSRVADVLLVAPASADFLARCAQGRADDLLSTLVLARNCPLLVAPAMNRHMWENPATQRNVAQLIADQIQVLGPATGEQACGEVGEGRMLEPADILEHLAAFLTEKSLLGKRVLMTAGPTFEAIDAVRGMTNLSSGRMGYAIAQAAQRAGAVVTLVSGPVSLPKPLGVARLSVTSAREMHAEVMSRAGDADIFIGVAAVADYRPVLCAEHKLKKDHGGMSTVELIENPDILATVAALPEPPFCVGFAAESQNLSDYAQQKRRKKNIPLIAANWIQEGFGGEENRLVLFDDRGEHPLPAATKSVLARQLIQHIAQMTGTP